MDNSGRLALVPRATHIAPVEDMLDLDVMPRLAPPMLRLAPPPGAVPGPLAELEKWIGHVMQAAVEIVGGDRPAAQVVRWTDRRVYQHLQDLASQLGRAGRYPPATSRVQRVRPRVKRVRLCYLGEHTVEAAVTVVMGGRMRAVAAEFRKREQGWVCTAIDFGLPNRRAA